MHGKLPVLRYLRRVRGLFYPGRPAAMQKLQQIKCRREVGTNGHDKFDYHFEQEIDAVYPTSDGQVYTLIDSSTIQKIRLQTK